MELWMWAAAGVLGLGALVWLFWGMRGFGTAVKLERAREMFKLQRERLETYFIQAAGNTGKPRGLRWKDCQFENGVHFVKERASGQLAALVGVTISFEAIEGGEMDGVAAVGNLRHASAVFFYHGGQWSTVGKAVFNMNPEETIKHFEKQYERIDRA